MRPKIEFALAAIARGWRVHPLRPNDKRPILPDWPNLASSSKLYVELWWSRYPDANIGIATGRESGVAVVDIDGAAGHAIARARGIPFETFSVRSVREGGLHLYFSTGEQTIRSRGAVFPKIDVRGEGGYIVGPGSTIDGRTYTVEKRAELLPFPAAVTRASVRTLRRRKNLIAGNRERMQPIESYPTIGPGDRNNTLASVCGQCIHHGLDAPETLDYVAALNRQRCDPPLSEGEVGELVRGMVRRYR